MVYIVLGLAAACCFVWPILAVQRVARGNYVWQAVSQTERR